MGITIKHGKPSTLLTAAQIKGEERAAQQQLERTERLQAQQREFEYRTAIRQQDLTIDLQMQERAKLWEIQKMELRSQIDFQREEKQRQRKLDSYDNVDAELDKQVLSGNVSEEDVKLYRFKNDLARQGMNVSISELRQQQEDRFGVRPYWMRGRDAPEGTPERQLYEAKLAEGISGERMGTRPYYFDPSFLNTYPEAARQAQEARGIFLSDEEFNAMARGEEAGLPLGDKQLDVGVRAEGRVEGGRIGVVSPEGQTGTILESELQEYIDQGYTVRGAGATGTWEEEPMVETSVTKRTKRRKATIGTIDWDYIMGKGFK